MTRERELGRIEAAMETLGRVGRSRAAAARRARRAGLTLAGNAQQVLRRVVEHAPVRISDLARHVHMSDALVSRQVSALEAAGLVARQSSREDGRVALVTATAAGKRASARLRAAADSIFAEHLSGWSVRELAALAAPMERLASDLKKPESERRRAR
jgi:DNA-binding MarR family transcriptional regulator